MGPRLSGITYLTVVIRLILAYLRAVEWDRQRTRQQEIQNPLLQFAWLTFDPTNTALQEPLVKDLAEALWGRSLEAMVEQGRVNELSFEGLVNAAWMAQTVWSWPELQLFKPFLWMREGDDAWSPFDPSSAPSCVTKWLQDLHLVPLPRVIGGTLLPTTDLSKEMDERFGELTTPSGDVTLILRPRLPSFLHMLYEIGDATSNGGGLVTLEQIRKIRIHKTGYVGEGPEAIYTTLEDTADYWLLAMVKCRSSPDDSDFIRVYDLATMVTEPSERAGELRGYTTRDWKIDEFPVGTKLFLLYGRCDHWPAAPLIPDSDNEAARRDPEAERLLAESRQALNNFMRHRASGDT